MCSSAFYVRLITKLHALGSWLQTVCINKAWAALSFCHSSTRTDDYDNQICDSMYLAQELVGWSPDATS